MEKLSYEVVMSKGDGFSISGVGLVQSYSIQPTKNGGSFIGGVISCPDGQLNFKAWSNSAAYEDLSEENRQNVICGISGSVNVYNGAKSIIVDSISIYSQEYIETAGLKISDFMLSKYNVDAYWEKYIQLVKKNVSENGWECFSAIIEGKEESLKTEFAALFRHDNCRGGLLAHQLKVSQIASIVRLYPNIMNKVGSDLLYIGCSLHDIGKIQEYNYGSITDIGRRLSHNTLGAIMLSEKRDKIVSLMGEKFYNDLIAIMTGHHGEYGDPPRTIAAYVIFQLDYLESRLTSLDEMIETSSSDIEGIRHDGFTLS